MSNLGHDTTQREYIMGQKSADLAAEVSSEVKTLIRELEDIASRAKDALAYLAEFA